MNKEQKKLMDEIASIKGLIREVLNEKKGIFERLSIGFRKLLNFFTNKNKGGEK